MNSIKVGEARQKLQSKEKSKAVRNFFVTRHNKELKGKNVIF